jgi:hypothetical protein
LPAAYLAELAGGGQSLALANHQYLEGQTTVPDIEKVFSAELGLVWSGQPTARDGTRKIADQVAPLLGK